VSIKQVKITFPAAGNYRYKIETSNDGTRWLLAADQTQTTSTSPVRTEVLGQKISAHLLRISFTGPAALAELEISGRLSAQ
jgi:hypothetical protein